MNKIIEIKRNYLTEISKKASENVSDADKWIFHIQQELSGDLNEEDVSKNHIERLAERKKIPSKLHGSYVVALRQLPEDSDHIETRRNAYQMALKETGDEDERNWIAEIIQNAKDSKATQINIKITENELSISHNGLEFETDELMALLNPYSSTKTGDVATIGQFGVGFKYWYSHFEKVRISSYSNKFKHTLEFQKDFKSKNSSYYIENDDSDSNKTTFIFNNPVDKNKWRDFSNKDAHSILNKRIEDCLPMLQIEDSDLKICIETANEEINYTCKIDELLYNEDFILERISYGILGDEKTRLRARISLLKLKEFNESEWRKFYDKVKQEYKSSNKYQNQLREEKGATKELEEKILEQMTKESFEKTYITIVLTLGENESGAISRLFGAFHSEVKFCFIADAPWKLSQDRHRIDTSNIKKQAEWNISVAKLVKELYKLTVNKCLNDKNNFELKKEEMFELLNRPIEKIEDLNSTNIFLKNDVKSAFELKDNDAKCSKSLLLLWKKLSQMLRENQKILDKNGDKETKENIKNLKFAIKWLDNSLNKKLAVVNLANKEKCPIRISCLDELDDNYSEICQGLGKGIPELIKGVVEEFDVEETSEDVGSEQIIATGTYTINQFNNQTIYFQNDKIGINDYLDMFDDIVADSKGKIYFLGDIEDGKILDIEEETEERNLIEGIIKKLEKTLEEKLFYYLDCEKNLNGHERKLVDAIKFGEGMEILVERIFEESGSGNQEKYEKILRILIKNKPTKLDWGRALLVEKQDSNHQLIMLPPKEHCLGIFLNNTGSIDVFSISTKSLQKNKIIINSKKPKILQWGIGIKSDIIFARTKNIPLIEIGKRDFEPTEWIPNSLLENDNQDFAINDNNYIEISLDGYDLIAQSEIENRIDPYYIDTFHTEVNDLSVHRGVRLEENGIEFLVNKNVYSLTRIMPTRSVDFMVDDIRKKLEKEVTLPEVILKSAINLDGKEVKIFTTEKVGENEKIVPKFSGDEKIGGLVRILGSISMICDQNPLDNIDQLKILRNIHTVSYWNERIMNQIEAHSKFKQHSKKEVFDVIWVQGNETKKLGLTSHHIRKPARRGFTKKIKYLDDENLERTTGSACFNSLKNEMRIGFQDTDIISKDDDGIFIQLSKISVLKDKVWLPRISEVNPKEIENDRFDIWNGIIPIWIHGNQNIERILKKPIAGNHFLRPGVDQLIQTIEDDDNSDLIKSLEWLEELLSMNMLTAKWLNKRKERIILKKIKENGLEEKFGKIMEKVKSHSNVTWESMQEAIYNNATNEDILRDYNEVRMPILMENENFEIDYEKGPTIEEIKKSNSEYYYIQLEDLDGKLPFDNEFFNQKDSTKILIIPKNRKIETMLIDSCELNISRIEISKCLLNSDIKILKENKIIRPEGLKYVSELMRHLQRNENPIEVDWYNYESREVSEKPLSPSKNCIAINLHDDENRIIISVTENVNNISYENHLLISTYLKEILVEEWGIRENKIIEEVRKRSIISLWWSILRINNDIEAEKISEFENRYCWGRLKIKELEERLEEIENKEDLSKAMEKLTIEYGNLSQNSINSALKGSKEWLNDLYEGIPSIIPDQIFFKPLISQQYSKNIMNQKRDIPTNMLNQLESIGTIARIGDEKLKSLGTTLLANPIEDAQFNGFAANFPDRDKLDFSPEVLDSLESSITQLWFNKRSEYILVKNMFKGNNSRRFDGKIHKYHAIHIFSYLKSRSQ
jgi:hypothetical protein